MLPYSEIRIAEAFKYPSRLVKSSRDVAVAITSAPAFLSGIGDDFQLNLGVSARMAHAPEEAERLLAAQAVASEAARVEAGLAELQPAFYVETLAARVGTYVDVDAPMTAPAAE